MKNTDKRPDKSNTELSISECSCRGLNALNKLSNYYMDRFNEDLDMPRNKKYEDAKNVANELYNILTDKGVTYKEDIPPVEWIKKDHRTNIELDDCNTYGKSSCVTALEIIAGHLHRDLHTQRKLICGRNDKDLSNDEVDFFLTDIFRGYYYGATDESHKQGGDKILYDPFEYHFSKFVEPCKKYKK